MSNAKRMEFPQKYATLLHENKPNSYLNLWRPLKNCNLHALNWMFLAFEEFWHRIRPDSMCCVYADHSKKKTK